MDRISDFDVKLLDIDCESLSLPDTHYKATVDPNYSLLLLFNLFIDLR